MKATLLGILLLTSTALAPAGAAADGAQEPHEYNRGFQLGLGWGASDLHVDLDGRQQIPAADAGFGASGAGMEIVTGWGFGPRFRTEFSLYFASHDARSGTFEVYSGGIRFDGVFTLLPKARVQPELIAGMGYGGIVYADENEPDYLYGWLQGDMGAGLRWRLGERWSLDGCWVLSILNVEREVINSDDADDDTFFVDGDGHQNRFALKLVYDF